VSCDGSSEVLWCEVAGVTADVATVDALARLALAARRRGWCVRLCGASEELHELVGFMGLGDVLRDSPQTRERRS
jgi:hypothetical protein